MEKKRETVEYSISRDSNDHNRFLSLISLQSQSLESFEMCEPQLDFPMSRYCSKEMMEVFSNLNKYTTWRKLWIILAKCQKEIGANISDEQIQEMENNVDKIDLEKVRQEEIKTKHEVMAHIHVFASQCPMASSIIHLGATSCFVGDNCDILLIQQGLILIKRRIVFCIDELSKFARKYSDQPTLGYTHLQPAQLTTIGKRACLWLNDLCADYENVKKSLDSLKLRGIQGTVGTQASFTALFNNDRDLLLKLNKLFCEFCNFNDYHFITGQTYPRKSDCDSLYCLCSLATSLHKMFTDIRLLCGLQEIGECFTDTQVGSSAMPYKRNPMRSERVCSIARYVQNTYQNFIHTASLQWLERSLDDSASRRLCIPQIFQATDAILSLAEDIISGLVVYQKNVENHIQMQLPFLASETIMIEMVKAGGDRQFVHSKLKEISISVFSSQQDQSTDDQSSDTQMSFVSRIKNDSFFSPIHSAIDSGLLRPINFIGQASFQTHTFLDSIVNNILENEALNLQSRDLSKSNVMI